MSTQVRPTLRERQNARTRDEIEDAALGLFARQGYDATTVEQIAAAAGVSTRTFFRYFPTKEDAVFGDHAEVVARFRAALAAATARDGAASPLDRVRVAVLATQQPGRRPDHEITRARLVAGVPALRARFEILAEDLEDAAAAALAAALGPAPDADLRARILAGAAFGALRAARRAAATLPDPDPERLVETAFALLGPAFRPGSPPVPDAGEPR